MNVFLPANILACLFIYACLYPFQQTFKLGLSYPPLAQVGLETLEYWISCIPGHVLVPYFKDILPCFDGYLKTAAEG